ncbi:MAG: methyltransferase domain-containing protein [Planctomycetota bacterium]
MSRSRRSSAQKYHDRVAPIYDHSYDDAYWKWHDDLTWDYLKPYLPTNLSAEVVDLGCGTGKWAARLAKSGFRVTCVDISARMLDQARAKVEPAAGVRGADFLQADLGDLTAIPDGRFHLAVAFGEPIACTESPSRALKEICRIMTLGGVLVATFDNRFAAIDHYLEKGDPKELSRFLRNGRTNWLTKDAEERFEIHTFSPADLKKTIEATGFEMLTMVGKTVLPMRHHRQLLETPQGRREWSRIEKSLSRDNDALACAPHLQVACRRK